MKKLRTFSAQVTYKDSVGVSCEETFPVTVADYDTAKDLAFRYVVEVLKLKDFELRIAGG
jgi:hypothetical protein